MNVLPPMNIIHTNHRILVDSEAGKVLTDFLLDFRMKNRLRSFNMPVLPGTHTFIVDAVRKWKW